MSSPYAPLKSPAPALSQKALVGVIKDKFTGLTDVRTGKNTSYEVSDAALSAFAVFFLQNPSFLAQQITLQKAKGKNNLQTLFGAYDNPCDNQIRHLLDEVSPCEFDPIFSYIFNGLHASGYFKPFTVLGGSLLVALDGVEYFSSEKIHCDNCSTQVFANGKIRYSHKVVTPVIVSPRQGSVIPLAPEFVSAQDGHSKQDCELAAASRWLLREGPGFAQRTVTILGDDLFSHQPYCEAVKAQNMHLCWSAKKLRMRPYTSGWRILSGRGQSAP
jgi:hypothetical protein